MNYELSDNTWDDKEIRAINRVIQSNRFTMGREVEKYENMFANIIGAKFAVMSNSGSSANLLAVASLVYSGILKAGDEIIIPAVSWSTTFFPFFQFGLKIIFVDVNLNTLNIDLEQIEDAITENTKALCSVNLLGNPNDYDKIQEICKKRDLILIEDNCESMGGKYRNKFLGTFGLVGTYSTFYSHHLCTMEGGITVTNNEELYHYMLCIRAHGWTRNLPINSKLYLKNKDDFYESFNFIVPGFNLRPLEIEAAIGIEQLNKMEDIVKQRRLNAKHFIYKMKDIQDILLQKDIGESSWFGFSIILIGKNKGKRNLLVKRLKQEKIEVRPIVAGNFTRNPVIKYLNYKVHGMLVNADIVHDNGFFVGNHSHDNSRKIDFLYKILLEELH